jgi:hypothetical protein
MISGTYHRIHEPTDHASQDHWSCAVCGKPVPVHGARRGWMDGNTPLPPTCSAAHAAQAAALIKRGVVFHRKDDQ